MKLINLINSHLIISFLIKGLTNLTKMPKIRDFRLSLIIKALIKDLINLLNNFFKDLTKDFIKIKILFKKVDLTKDFTINSIIINQ